ncbi:MAG: hypothetical protein Roseis2KO_15240 [Roseivirga sp.]
MEINDNEVSAKLPTKYGLFYVKAYRYLHEEQPNLAFYTSDIDTSKAVYVRIHSECMTGDVFGSRKCDCGEQLDYSMKWVQQHGGIVLYLRQEGRGIGLINKLKAYNLQEEGFNTRVANLELGFHEDTRDYAPALAILKDLGVRKINLLTNNPQKIDAFEGSGIEVTGRTPVEIEPHDDNLDYLKTKKEEMGHLLFTKLS